MLSAVVKLTLDGAGSQNIKTRQPHDKLLSLRGALKVRVVGKQLTVKGHIPEIF